MPAGKVAHWLHVWGSYILFLAFPASSVCLCPPSLFSLVFPLPSPASSPCPSLLQATMRGVLYQLWHYDTLPGLRPINKSSQRSPKSLNPQTQISLLLSCFCCWFFVLLVLFFQVSSERLTTFLPAHQLWKACESEKSKLTVSHILLKQPTPHCWCHQSAVF